MYAELLRVVRVRARDAPGDQHAPTRSPRGSRSSPPPADLPRTLTDAGRVGRRSARRSRARPRNSGPARSTRARSTRRAPWRFTNARSNRRLVVLRAGQCSLAGCQQPSWPQFRANPQLTGVASSPLPPVAQGDVDVRRRRGHRVVCRNRRRRRVCRIGRGRADRARSSRPAQCAGNTTPARSASRLRPWRTASSTSAI